MIKRHVIHHQVDGTNNQHITQFETLVDQAQNDVTREVRKIDFFVSPAMGRTGVFMTAIVTYVDRPPALAAVAPAMLASAAAAAPKVA